MSVLEGVLTGGVAGAVGAAIAGQLDGQSAAIDAIYEKYKNSLESFYGVNICTKVTTHLCGQESCCFFGGGKTG